MSKLILGFVGILGVFTAQATTPEGKPLVCIVGNSPIPVTGFRPPSDGRIEMKVQNSAGGIVCYFCARNTGTAVENRLSFGVFSDSSWWHFHYNKKNNQIPDNFVKVDRQLILSVSAKGGIVVNGVQVPNSAVDEADFVPGGDLVLLAAQEAFTGVGYANAASYVFYWARVYDAEDNLVASFAPWLSKTESGDDVPGVLDEKTGIFYPVDAPQGITQEIHWFEEPGHRLTWCATKIRDTTVDTGFVPSSKGRIEMKLALTPPDNQAFQPFGASTGDTNVTMRRSFGIGFRESFLDFHYNGTTHSLDASGISFYRVLTMSVSAKDGIFVNGSLVEGSAIGTEDFTVGSTLTIFSANGVDWSNMRFYWLKVYDEADNLVASYVPWVDDFGVVGVCNELTGEFIAPTVAGDPPGLYAGRTVSAEMTGRRTAKVKVSAMPEGVRGLPSDLCLWPVCDAEDKGENLADWTYKGNPVRISREACEVEVEFPKQYKGANRFGRILLAAGESLAASGEQYAELNRPLTDADGVEIVFSSANLQQQSMIFGSRFNANKENISALLNNGGACVDFCNGEDYSAYRINPSLTSTNIYQIVDDKYRRATTNLTTGAEVPTPNTTEYTGEAFSQPGNCRIFGASAGAPSGYGNFVGSIYSFRVYESATGKTLYNLMPGKNANGEPCFVDTLTGDFYENKGSGNFILDADTSVSASFVMPPLKKPGVMVLLR